jgi:hypothetical protein
MLPIGSRLIKGPALSLGCQSGGKGTVARYEVAEWQPGFAVRWGRPTAPPPKSVPDPSQRALQWHNAIANEVQGACYDG